MATSTKKPLKYAGVTVVGPELHRVPVQPGKVLIVRGRTSSTVYHTDHHCAKLRGVGRFVKVGYAMSAGRVRCEACRPEANQCGPECYIGRHPTVKPTTNKARLYELRQLHLNGFLNTTDHQSITETVEAQA